MIEKLDVMKDTRNVIDKDGMCHTAANFTAIEKINELCDVINAIQKEREAERFEIQEWIGILEAVRKSVNVHEKQIDELQMKLEPEKCESPVDPFAEQRSWIGKLCWVWDDDDNDRTFAKLIEIIEDDGDRPFKCFTRWKHCEPVKPDDDIIYKGE